MSEEELSEQPDKVWLYHRPFNMTPLLNGIQNKIIDGLVKNSNTDVYYGLIQHLKIKQNRPLLDCIIGNSYFLDSGAEMSKWHKDTILRRAALGVFWKRFSRVCLRTLASASENGNKRSYSCDPIGFFDVARGKKFPCRNLFCPNCYVRQTNCTRKKLTSLLSGGQTPENITAVIIKSNSPFQDKAYGFEAIIPKDITRLVTRKLVTKDYVGVKTTGAVVDNRTPYFANRLAVMSVKDPKADFSKLLTPIKKYLLKRYPERQVKIYTVVGLDNICLELYDCCPVCLAGISDLNLRSSTLQHTLDNFKQQIRSTKRIQFFGPGVK